MRYFVNLCGIITTQRLAEETQRFTKIILNIVLPLMCVYIISDVKKDIEGVNANRFSTYSVIRNRRGHREDTKIAEQFTCVARALCVILASLWLLKNKANEVLY